MKHFVSAWRMSKAEASGLMTLQYSLMLKFATYKK